MKRTYVKYPIEQSPLFKLRSHKKLAFFLYSTPNKLKLLKHSQPSDLYQHHYIDDRLITVPRKDLKSLQKRLSNLLLRIQSPDYLHSPAKRRSIITNAKSHLGYEQIHTFDISKYFQSVSKQKVFDFFLRDLQCSRDVSATLTSLCTLNECLPTGSPSSPILAYLSLLGMWNSIESLARKFGCTLTVYADDVAISGKRIPKELRRKIKCTFSLYGLQSKKKKERHYHNSKPCNITGVILEGDRLKAPQKLHKKFHILQKLIKSGKVEGVDKQKAVASLQGVRAYIKSIEETSIEAQDLAS